MTCFPLKTDGTFLSIQMSAIFLGADSLCYKNRWIASNISIQNLHPNSQEVTILRHSSFQGGAGFCFFRTPFKDTGWYGEGSVHSQGPTWTWQIFSISAWRIHLDAPLLINCCLLRKNINQKRPIKHTVHKNMDTWLSRNRWHACMLVPKID